MSLKYNVLHKSPLPGLSILITLAPRSDNLNPAAGPDKNWLNSKTVYLQVVYWLLTLKLLSNSFKRLSSACSKVKLSFKKLFIIVPALSWKYI